MPGSFHGWLYSQDEDGTPYEIINHARTAAYLRNVSLPNGMLLCNILDDGGCAAYPYDVPCGPGETENPSYVSFPLTSTQVNVLTIPDNANFSAPTQLDIRFAITRVLSGSTVRYIMTHRSSAANNIAWMVQLDASDRLVFITSTNGTATVTATCDDPLVTTDDLVLGRITWRSSDGRVQFFRKTEVFEDTIGEQMDSDLGWEQRGTNEIAATAALFNSSSTMNFGNRDGTVLNLPFIGRIYAASLATTIDGSPVVRWTGENITNAAASSFPASTGQTVTVVRAGSGNQLSLFVDTLNGWEPVVYDTPANDTAPWYSSLRPQSADALGFWIEEWTGLDNAHVVRSKQPLGRSGGGSQLGNLSATDRIMSLNVFLFARSEEAMQYLFDWLASRLSNICSTCDTDMMLIRRYCPETIADLWEGVAQLRDVGLETGPTWGPEVLDTGRCFMRRVNFVLSAGDPCMYAPGTDIEFEDPAPDLAACLTALDVSPNLTPCRPTCIELEESSDCRWIQTFEVELAEMAVAPVLTLTNEGTEYSVPCRVQFLADPLDLGVSNLCSLLVVGQLYVRALRPGASLQWDVIGRERRYRDHTTAGMASGAAYIDANDPPIRRDFVLPCNTMHVVVELGNRCLDEVDTGVWSDGVHIFEDPHFPTPSLETMSRVGCP